MLPASFSEVSQAFAGSNSIYIAASLGTRLPSKKSARKCIFSEFIQRPVEGSGEPFSGLSCGGIALQYTDE